MLRDARNALETIETCFKVMCEVITLKASYGTILAFSKHSVSKWTFMLTAHRTDTVITFAVSCRMIFDSISPFLSFSSFLCHGRSRPYDENLCTQSSSPKRLLKVAFCGDLRVFWRCALARASVQKIRGQIPSKSISFSSSSRELSRYLNHVSIGSQ